ncbi:MAG: phosphodiesterase YaeI [Acidobacteria bacterium]|nr:phosphodiesterase YaeI [Acidobacteriota bacterium]
MTRRKFWVTAGVALGAPALDAGYIEPRWLELSFVPCRLPHLAAPVRLLHLSDLHVSPLAPRSLVERAFDMGRETKPDLVCLTGDFITNGENFDVAWYESVLRRLSRSAPCYASMGNHDGGFWAHTHGGFGSTVEISELLRRGGIETLHNRAVDIQIAGQRLRLAGVGDLWSREIHAEAAFAGAPAPSTPSLLLSHNPDSKDHLGQYPWHLMLSGHTHGGQVSLPLIGTPFAPVRDHRYVEGLRPWRDRQIHVTRGVGSILGVRFNCRPQVSVLELMPSRVSS